MCESECAHTARDASKDITNMVSHLLNEKVTMELEHRETHIKFEDPSIAGCRRIACGHIDKYLKGEVDNENTSGSTDDEMIENLVDINYELYDVV